MVNVNSNILVILYIDMDINYKIMQKTFTSSSKQVTLSSKTFIRLSFQLSQNSLYQLISPLTKIVVLANLSLSFFRFTIFYSLD